MNISAVILSDKPVDRAIDGITVVPFISKFSGPGGLLASRFASIERVKTEWFFMLDDDDDLPDDYIAILEECVAGDEPLAYTSELITNDDGSSSLKVGDYYTEAAFLSNPTLIHHLAVCRTDAALDAMKTLPLGCFAFEHLLYFAVAKRGARFVDRVGYIWHRRSAGLHNNPRMPTAILNSVAFATRGQQ